MEPSSALSAEVGGEYKRVNRAWLLPWSVSEPKEKPGGGRMTQPGHNPGDESLQLKKKGADGAHGIESGQELQFTHPVHFFS